jgi:beta-glucosidase-like glycosyl hydrolase
LLYRRAVAIGEEARGKGINTQFGPGVNLLRVPEAGRAFECESHTYNLSSPCLLAEDNRECDV